MELLILNTELEAVAVVDTFESLIWTDRYYAYGDFEIYTAINNEVLTNFKKDYYIWVRDSDHVMIIEGLQINSDAETGNHLTITGRSLESILDRRIIWRQTILRGDFQKGVEKLLNENVINPIISDRRIDNFVFEATDDPIITQLTIDAQFTGDNLYTAINKLCEANDIGFKVTLTNDNKFVFKLYSGTDRSYNQLTIPYVTFSPKFENIINSNYLESNKTLKTVSLVAGEGEGAERRTTTTSISSGAGTGLSRRELFTDARDISSKTEDGTLTEDEYNAQLVQRGTENLAENILVKSFEGKVDSTRMYKYGEDFFMGDIVQIANEYGIESRVRVTEVVRSQNTTSIDVYPTFSNVV